MPHISDRTSSPGISVGTTTEALNGNHTILIMKIIVANNAIRYNTIVMNGTTLGEMIIPNESITSTALK